jgi:Protein of unknown function with PCYCGC motif
MKKKLLTLACATLFAVSTSAQWLGGPTDVPAYNASAPKKGETLPAILAPDAVHVMPGKYAAMQKHAYVVAAKIPRVIHQQPCYCYCDRGHGHNSLHSCFESEHGANCAACLKEVYYAYKMTKAKKTPTQIRQGIIAGEWKAIDLETAAAIN